MKYHLTPEEFVQLLEPIYGNRNAERASGFSEEEVRSAEERLGIRIPKVYRHYLLTCGKAGLNSKMHFLYQPDQIEFSYDVIEQSIQEEWEEEWKNYSPDPENPYFRIHQLPREKWGEVTGNYLMIWEENQGCFHAGIRMEDLEQEDPPVSITVDDDFFEWAEVSNSIESFLFYMMLEFLSYVPEKELEGEEAITAFLKKHGVDTEKLFPQEAPFRCLHTRTFWNEEEKTLGVCVLSHEKEGIPEHLYLFRT